MFFVPIGNLVDYSKEQQTKIDLLLTRAYRENAFFTPHTFARELRMSVDEAWDLNFKLVEIGAIYRTEGSICTSCGKQFARRKPCTCKGEVRSGYYWRVRAN